MNSLLAGGGGFIGQHLARLLTTRSRKIFELGWKSSPSGALTKEVTYIAGDYGDEQTFGALLNQVEEVVDLPYATVAKSSFDDPVVDLQGNLPPAVGLLQQAGRPPTSRADSACLLGGHGLWPCRVAPDF